MAVEPDSAGVRFPPPFVYLGALLLGLAAERFVVLRSFGIDWRLLIATGALLFVAGAALMLAAAGLFRQLGTNIPPAQPTTLIATTGPYRWTRNPMYLGACLCRPCDRLRRADRIRLAPVGADRDPDAGDRPRGALSRGEVRRRLPPLQGRGSPLALTIPPLPPAGPSDKPAIPRPLARDMHPIRDRRVVLGMTGFDRGNAPFLFDPERRLRCAIAQERDIASAVADPVRRAGHLSRARALSARLPQSACERLLLIMG